MKQTSLSEAKGKKPTKSKQKKAPVLPPVAPMGDVVYQSHKQVKAYAMNKEVFCTYRGWDLPANEDPNEEGYLVEYLDGGASNDNRHDGYISWTPKKQFDTGYTSTKLFITDADRAITKQHLIDSDKYVAAPMSSLDKVTMDKDFLNDKLKALYLFNRSPQENISPPMRDLLMDQEKAMLTYSNILSKRITLLK